MPTVAAIAAFLEQLAPARLAEAWDNVGLLVGRREREVGKLMTCLTITPDSVAEATEEGVDLIVSHHPMPFRPMQRLTGDSTAGGILLDLIEAGVAVYSSHTAFDSTDGGVNDRIAEGLKLRDVVPLVPNPEGQGTGRRGRLAEPLQLGELARRLKTFFKVEQLCMVGRSDQLVHWVGIGCGAADELFDVARQSGCDAVVLGEARFHTCVEAQARGVGLLLPGHYASERFAVERLAEVLARQFPELTVWASKRENDPVRWG
jgi:dinuclear metal center YbgI/SA1388 family protein